ncbi:MAG: YbjN domain-containing protein [Clostridia bacterium]|nr:YbjN domain-containing protein [Clostridia bacterium]
MAYSGIIADTLREAFSAAGILATFEDKNGVGVFSIRMKLRCRLQSAQMIVLVREDNFSTITTLPLTADTDHRLAMAEYLTRANWNMRNGNFELNMDDGEIRYKSYVHVGKEKPDMAAARLATMLPFLMIDRYGDGLIDVLFGFKTPREAFESIGS